MTTDHQSLDHAALLARSRPRPDATDKLRADARYLTDRVASDQLHGALVASTLPHARIIRVDTSAALAMSGVHAVVTAADIPGDTHYGLLVVDRPVLCSDVVRCIGDPIAAVAADTIETARAAAARVVVEYAPLATVDDAASALRPDSERVHAGRAEGNLLHEVHYRQAPENTDDLAANAADCIADVTYEIPRQMHAFLETEGGVVEPDGHGGFAVYFGGHNPERDRQVIAAMLAIDPERVRAIGTPVGGSYGGKDELTIQPIAALLTWKTGRKVRLHLDRVTSTDLGVKRHAMTIRMKSRCRLDGTLLSHEVDILADTGAYATHGPEVLNAAVEHAVGPYAWRAVTIDARLAYTNNGIAGAFRGFGAVQSQFALECQLDRLAALAGIDPAVLRERNLAAADAPGPMGQVVVPFDGVHRALDVARQHALWRGPRRWGNERYRHGVGMALIHRSDGYGRGGPNASRIVVALAADGMIEIRTGFTELGQNLVGAVAALGARHLGCADQDVRAVLGDSALTPNSGAVAASRATTAVDRGLRTGGPAFVRALRESAAHMLASAPSSDADPTADAHALTLGPGGLYDRNAALQLSLRELARHLGADALPTLTIEIAAHETPTPVESAHFVFGACAALAQVRVDTWSGNIKVEHFALIPALGPVISPLGFVGQMEGGALMGQGLATCERLPMRDGRYLNRNLDAYLIPTLADAPRWDVIAIQNVPDDDPVGPRGAGEISVNVAPPAIANAITAAIGFAPTRLPIEPDEILDHLDRLDHFDRFPTNDDPNMQPFSDPQSDGR